MSSNRAVYGAVDNAVYWVVAGATTRAVYVAYNPAVGGAIDQAVYGAVNDDLSHLGLEIYFEVGR